MARDSFEIIETAVPAAKIKVPPYLGGYLKMKNENKIESYCFIFRLFFPSNVFGEFTDKEILESLEEEAAEIKGEWEEYRTYQLPRLFGNKKVKIIALEGQH